MRSLTKLSPVAIVLRLFLACLLGLLSLSARAGDADMSKETKACLDCHNKKGQVKKLDNGETLSLYIAADKFAHSMHGETDCEDLSLIHI